MCIITKKLKVIDVREKRLAMRNKLQGQMDLLSFAKKLSLGSSPIII